MLASMTEWLSTELDSSCQGGGRAAVIAVRSADHVDCAALARPGTATALTVDSPFVLYSITKTFLAAAALRLVARRVLRLDDRVGRWLPWAPHGDRITLRHLLQHTSGLPDYGGLAAYHAAVRAGAQPWTDAEFLSRTRAGELAFEPGAGWAYSNVGYLLVRRLLEAAAQVGLPEVLGTELFAPLGLFRTFVATDADLPRLTFGPSASLGSGVEVAARYHLGWVAHGVVASTAAEVARFLDALLGGELLPPALLAEARALRVVGPMPGHPFRRPAYGLGLQGDAGAPAAGVLGHAGGGPGASTAVYRTAGRGGALTVGVLTDCEGAVAERLAIALLARLVA